MSEQIDETPIVEKEDAEQPAETWQQRHGATLIAGGMFLLVAILIVFELLT